MGVAPTSLSSDRLAGAASGHLPVAVGFTAKQMPDVLRSATGRSECIANEARRTDRQWIKGVRIARDRFG